MRRLSIGVIGCGRMGRERSRHIGDAGADIVAVYDPDLQRARELASSIRGCIAVSDETAFPWSMIDAVFVCTPPGMRESAVRMAIANHVAVFIEKPFALDADDAARMAQAIGEADVVAAVGYMNRYRATVRRARELLRGSPPVALSAVWTCGKYAVPWWEHPEISGGPFNEQATHLVDLVRYLAGEILHVRAVCVGETRVAAALTTASSCVATLLYSCDATEKHIAIDVVTAEGHLRLSGWDFALAENTISGSHAVETENPFQIETRAFLESVSGVRGSRILCSPEDAAATQRAVDAIRISFARARETAAI